MKFDIVRDELMLDAHLAGDTLDTIGQRFGIGHERVSQILKRARHTRWHHHHHPTCRYCERAKWQGDTL